MIGASVQHALNFRNLAFQNFYFMAPQVYVCERNLRIAFQCFQKLPEPHQIDIEGILTLPQSYSAIAWRKAGTH
jgi:hypothetical protein